MELCDACAFERFVQLLFIDSPPGCFISKLRETRVTVSTGRKKTVLQNSFKTLSPGGGGWNSAVKNGFSRMGLQKGPPDSDSNWNWIWKTGRLEDWKTGGQENWRTGGLRGHCTRNCACGTVADKVNV